MKRLRRYAVLVATGALSPCVLGAADPSSARPRLDSPAVLDRLAARDTADALATLALLRQFGEESDQGSHQLATRAAQKAPGRRDLAWLEVRMCNRAADCDPAAAEQHLREIDGTNGVVWMRTLTHALAINDGAKTDSALASIGDSKRFYIYFNPLVAATAAELAAAQHPTAGKPTRKELAASAQTMIGVIAASLLPPLRPLGAACRGTMLSQPGRLEHCRRAAQVIERSDTFLVEGLGLSLQQQLWPLDSPESHTVAARRRVLQYRLEEYGRLSLAESDPTRFPIDVLDVLRTHEREQDGALVYFAKAGIAADPPANWVSTMPPRVP